MDVQACACQCHREKVGHVLLQKRVDITDPVEMALSCAHCWPVHLAAHRADGDASRS